MDEIDQFEGELITRLFNQLREQVIKVQAKILEEEMK